MSETDTSYVLSDDCSYRREAFGASIFRRSDHSLRFFDHAAAVCMEALFEPKRLDDAINAVAAHFRDRRSLEAFIEDAVASQIFIPGHDPHPTTRQFYTDRTDFHRSHLVAPLAIEFELTLRCRRLCTYCAYESHPGVSSAGELGWTQYKAAFQAARDAGVFYLRFTGGDPLLREDALEIITLASEMGFSVAVASDLSLITDTQIEGLAALPNLTFLQTTLDGPDPETADMQRGHGNFRCVISGIRRLRQSGVPVMVGTVLTTVNRSRIYETALALQAFDVSYCVSPLYSAGRGRVLENLIPSDADLSEAYEQFARAVSDGLVRPADPGWRAIAEGSSPAARETLWQSQPWLIRSPDRILRVTPHGQAYAGIQAKEMLGEEVHVGNVLESSIDDIWNKSRTLNSLRSQSSEHKYYGNVLITNSRKGAGHERNQEQISKA